MTSSDGKSVPAAPGPARELGLACTVCGTPTVPGARFCFNCGAPLVVVESAANDAGAERRVVTVLFGDLTDFTAWAEDLDPERVKVVTDRVLTGLAHAATSFGGYVDKLTGDGIMAVFGAPTAHEDDAERAVRAAVGMQRAVSRLVAEESGGGRQLGLRVGLNTGEVLAGVQAQLSYTVVGDTVNTAARLSDAAPAGGVLAGGDTATATMAVASWRVLEPLRLKGKREPVAAYELVELRPRAVARIGVGDEAPFIGREAELGLLVSRLHDISHRDRSATVVVTGEAGVGKTRLARELARVAGGIARARVLWGRCTPYGEDRGLAPVVDIVRAACGVTPDDDEDEVRRRVRRAAARADHPAAGAVIRTSLADALLALLGVGDDPVPSPREAATPGENVRGNLAVDAVARLLTGLAAEGPLLVVIDDLQWATAMQLDAIAAIADRARGAALIVGLGRSDLLADHRDWVEAMPDPEVLPVLPLEEPALLRLLRAYLGGADPEPRLRELMVDRAQGNPFFLGEMLHLLVDRGLLARQPDGGWQLAEVVPRDVLPAGVHAVLAARIDALPAPLKVLLRDAAVVGPRFWPAVLAHLAQLPRDTVDTRLRELVEREIALPGDGDSYAFGHTLTREVAYAGIPKADRARRHADVAVWAAAAMRAPAAEIDAFAAAHAERAVELAREMDLASDDPAWRARRVGVAALARLGDSSLARDDNAGAAAALDRAAALAADDASLVTDALRVSYAQSLAGVRRLTEAEAALEPALASGDVATRSRALVVLGDVRRKEGRDEDATNAFVRAMATASEAGLDQVAGEALRQVGLLDFFNGRLAAAEQRFTEALELAGRVGDARGAGWALQHLAWSATTRGDYDRADATLQRAADVFASFDDLGGIAWCKGTEAFVRLLEGRLGAARDLAHAVLAAGEAAGDEWGIGACLTIDAMAAAQLGDLTVALDESRQALSIFERLEDHWGRALALGAHAAAVRGTGDLGTAETLLRECVALAERARLPAVSLLGLSLLGWCQYDARELDATEATAQRALALVAALEVEAHAGVGAQVLLALVARARGDLGTALELLGGLAARPGRPTLLFPMRQALAHYAGTLLEAGRVDEAVSAAERALTVPAEDVRSQVVAWRALGNSLAAAGRIVEARDALDQALDVARATELRTEVAATSSALAALPA
ncbi:MAG: AAA family ATPase [Mycobacteriales bacterium]|nr:AAA family ATPase [Frankia sp.]